MQPGVRPVSSVISSWPSVADLDVYVPDSPVGVWKDLSVEQGGAVLASSVLAAVLTVAARTAGGTLADPVTAGSAVALCSMLVVSVTGYRYTELVLGGLGQVGPRSERYISAASRCA